MSKSTFFWSKITLYRATPFTLNIYFTISIQIISIQIISFQKVFFTYKFLNNFDHNCSDSTLRIPGSPSIMSGSASTILVSSSGSHFTRSLSR